MRPSQVLLDALLLFALAVTMAKYVQRRIKPVEAFLWSCIWIAALIVVTLPDATTLLARALGIGRGVDVVIYLSVPLGFYLVFRLYEKLDRLEHDLTKVVRHLALKESEPREAILPGKDPGGPEGSTRTREP